MMSQMINRNKIQMLKKKKKFMKKILNKVEGKLEIVIKKNKINSKI